jgi:glycosyltransferase involved in cell wall biosynthesis
VPEPELSAIVLCYRAGENVRRVASGLLGELRESGLGFELILVANYDDEADPTAAIAAEVAGANEEVRALTERKQGAMGWDMRRGFEAARGEHLVVIDGDEQNPLEDVLRAHRLLVESGAGLVKGRRIARFDGYMRHFVSVAYNALFLLLFRTRGLWDINGKPKGLTRAAYEQLELRADDWYIDAEIVLQARRRGVEIAELPVVFRQNRDRRSFVRGSAIAEFLRNMARSRWGRNRL